MIRYTHLHLHAQSNIHFLPFLPISVSLVKASPALCRVKCKCNLKRAQERRRNVINFHDSSVSADDVDKYKNFTFDFSSSLSMWISSAINNVFSHQSRQNSPCGNAPLDVWNFLCRCLMNSAKGKCLICSGAAFEMLNWCQESSVVNIKLLSDCFDIYELACLWQWRMEIMTSTYPFESAYGH